jgi:hypothetical protein
MANGSRSGVVPPACLERYASLGRGPVRKSTRFGVRALDVIDHNHFASLTTYRAEKDDSQCPARPAKNHLRAMATGGKETLIAVGMEQLKLETYGHGRARAHTDAHMPRAHATRTCRTHANGFSLFLPHCFPAPR